MLTVWKYGLMQQWGQFVNWKYLSMQGVTNRSRHMMIERLFLGVIMAISEVKLITASTLTALETAINEYITGLSGKEVTAVDIDVTTVRDVPQPVSLFVATISLSAT